MTFKQYRFLRGLHRLSPKMNEEQKYDPCFVCDVEKATRLSKEDVLTIATELAALGYVKLAQNSENAKERSGYIHLIVITYSGVVAKNEYVKSNVLSLLRNILVPAIVSITCSMIVHYLSAK